MEERRRGARRPAASRAASRASRIRALGAREDRVLAASPRRPRGRGSAASLLRQEIAGETEVSEVEIARHFTRLSRLNFSIDEGLYPLGSCTMKHNPRTNEEVARLPGFAAIHPLAPEEVSQGALELAWRLEQILIELTGLSRVTLQPSAGAQGELAGILMIRAALAESGNPRRTRLDSRLRARHESGVGPFRRLQGAGAQVERPRNDRPRRAREGHERGRRRVDADGSQHAGHLRGPDPRHRPHRARQGRIPLLRRGELQFLRRPCQARSDGHRRHAHEPPQDLFDAARGRRSGLGTGRGRRAARAVSSAADDRAQAGRDVHARFRPAALDRAAAHVSRKLRDVRAGALLHQSPTGTRSAKWRGARC